MDWTKVKAKHFLFNDYTLQDCGALVRLLCLTAHLERMPLESEMRQQVHYKSLTHLQQTLNRHSTTLQEVLNKVLEDVQGVDVKRDSNRTRQKRYREKKKDSNALNNAPDKIRGEKIREDNTKVLSEKKRFDFFMTLYERHPNPKRRDRSYKKFCSSVKSKKDADEIKVALDNFIIDSERLDDAKFAVQSHNWFGEWQEWVTPQLNPEQQKELRKQTAKADALMKQLRS